MDVNSLPKTVTRQRRGCDLNPAPTVPESSTLTTWLPSHPQIQYSKNSKEQNCVDWTERLEKHLQLPYKDT